VDLLGHVLEHQSSGPTTDLPSHRDIVGDAVEHHVHTVADPLVHPIHVRLALQPECWSELAVLHSGREHVLLGLASGTQGVVGRLHLLAHFGSSGLYTLGPVRPRPHIPR